MAVRTAFQQGAFQQNAFQIVNPVALTATIAVVVGMSGTLTVRRGLAATIPVQTSVSATLAARRGLSATIPVRANVTGTLTAVRGLASTIPVVSSGTGNLAVLRALTATIPVQVGLSGTLSDLTPPVPPAPPTVADTSVHLFHVPTEILNSRALVTWGSYYPPDPDVTPLAIRRPLWGECAVRCGMTGRLEAIPVRVRIPDVREAVFTDDEDELLLMTAYAMTQDGW